MQDPRSINLRGGSQGAGIIRWDRYSNPGLWASNPFGSDEIGLYVNSGGNLVYSYLGTATVLGAAGVGGATIPSLDAIFQGDQTLNLGALSTLTIDRSSGNNDVLTLTNTGAGSGDCIQITNVGTGKDINGTSGAWSFSKLGAGVALTMTLAGTADADSLVLTQGDFTMSDGKVAITNQDNEATLSVTNNGLTSAAALALAGSGTFTGSTTTSFVTVTPSGLTSGTAVYLVAAALTTGKGIHAVFNAITSGIGVHIASSVASTTLTGAGRLFKVDHTGNATGTGILSEFNSAAADETVIVKVTASAALALGTALAISASSMTTGSAITATDLDALTTGKGLHIASAATAITTTGRLLHVNHTGVTGTSATLAEFATAATDETILLALTANDMATGNMLNFGTNVALTTGQLIKAAHTTSVIADGGSMLRLSSTGINTGGATNGTMLDVQTTAQVAGTQVLFKAGAVTTGVVLSVISTTGLTSGSLIRATTATAGAIATNGAISFSATGNFTSTSRAGFLNVAANSTTGGTVAHVSATALTDGTILALDAVEATLTTGKYIDCYDGAASDFSVSKYGATVIAGSAIGTASLTQTAGDHVLTSGNIVLTSGHIKNTPQAIASANTAISIVTLVTTITNAAPTTHTLADGTVGQIKVISMGTYGGDAVITPANFVGTTITLNAEGDTWTGIFVGTQWSTLALSGTAAVA